MPKYNLDNELNDETITCCISDHTSLVLNINAMIQNKIMLECKAMRKNVILLSNRAVLYMYLLHD